MTETVIRVALADDDVLLREGLASLLERSGFVVAGQCGDGSQLIALIREQEPELAIVDIRMPPDHATEGLDAARVIRAEFPAVAILVLSAHVEVSRDDHVRIAVDDDGGPWGETGSSPDCGRGLVIVAGLAAQWGIAAPRDRAGRTVWALFEWPASR